MPSLGYSRPPRRDRRAERRSLEAKRAASWEKMKAQIAAKHAR